MSNYYNDNQKIINTDIGYNTNELNEMQTNILQNQKQNEKGIIPDNITRKNYNDLLTGIQFGFTNEQPKSIDNSYNEYYDYLKQNGLLKENYRAKIITNYITVNSMNRKIEPQVNISDTYKLGRNSLSFEEEIVNQDLSSILLNPESLNGETKTKRYLLKIKIPNNKFKQNDKIIIRGLKKTSLSMRNNFTHNNILIHSIVFTPNSTALTFICSYNDNEISFNPNFNVGMGINHELLRKYDTSNMTVSLSGFEANDLFNFSIGNIPINFLNSTHQVFFTNPHYKIINGVKHYDPDTLINIPVNGIVKKITGFYIKLDREYIGNTIINNNMIINLTFNYIGGIAYNQINSGYPITNENLSGNNIVYKKSKNYIYILLNKQPYYKSYDGTKETQIKFGDTNEISISKLDHVMVGFNSPSIYEITLPTQIKNIIRVRMINSIFPNNTNSITNINTNLISSNISSNTNNKNNVLYWQNEDDGDNIYSISLDTGTYTNKELEQYIMNAINNVKRIQTTLGYTNRSIMKVDINSITNITTFTSYKEARLIKPIINIEPQITDPTINNSPYIITILHKQHGLKKNDTIKFDKFISTNGIPDYILNTTHIIDNIIDINTYTIVLERFNILNDIKYTGGGYETVILVPNSFRLLFNYQDTIGDILGFRNVGSESSITSYNNIIKNNDPYANEYTVNKINNILYSTDLSGNRIPLQNNNILTKGYNYILMMIDKLNNNINISNIKAINNCFSIINLQKDQYNEMIYNSFVDMPVILNKPIDLGSLNISFYAPDGTIYNFGGINHTFTLEIISLDYIPVDTELISTRTNL